MIQGVTELFPVSSLGLLAWLIILATIPVGITGVALEHTFRTLFAQPAAAAVLLFVNGLIAIYCLVVGAASILRFTLFA